MRRRCCYRGKPIASSYPPELHRDRSRGAWGVMPRATPRARCSIADGSADVPTIPSAEEIERRQRVEASSTVGRASAGEAGVKVMSHADIEQQQAAAAAAASSPQGKSKKKSRNRGKKSQQGSGSGGGASTTAGAQGKGAADGSATAAMSKTKARRSSFVLADSSQFPGTCPSMSKARRDSRWVYTTDCHIPRVGVNSAHCARSSLTPRFVIRIAPGQGQ